MLGWQTRRRLRGRNIHANCIQKHHFLTPVVLLGNDHDEVMWTCAILTEPRTQSALHSTDEAGSKRKGHRWPVLSSATKWLSSACNP